MKRLWTLDDIKGFIKRYGMNTNEATTLINKIVPNMINENKYQGYYIGFGLTQSGSTIDGRFFETSYAFVNYATYIKWKSLIQAGATIPRLAKWMANNPKVNFQCKGLLQAGYQVIPQVCFANSDGTDISIGCIDMSTYKYIVESASNYYDAVVMYGGSIREN